MATDNKHEVSSRVEFRTKSESGKTIELHENLLDGTYVVYAEKEQKYRANSIKTALRMFLILERR